MSTADTQIPGYVRFVIAGLSGGGASFASHPFDLIKYRMQLSGKGGAEKLHKTSLHAARQIIQNEGILAVYDGLSASILRQLTLTMVRLGLYSAIVDKMTAADGTPPPLIYQILAGLVSGGLGAVIGNPADKTVVSNQWDASVSGDTKLWEGRLVTTDVNEVAGMQWFVSPQIALVRMATDGANPPNERKNYKNAIHAIKTIKETEGINGLWIGWKPAAVRCMVLNVTQIVLYKNTKVLLLKSEYFTDNTTLHVLCSVWTALASSVATAPIDITKTRLMTMKDKNEYTGMLDVARKVIQHEGVFALWKGFTPTFGRILPNNFMIFILLELFTKTYKTIILGDKSGSGF